ncbi:unnamed protein product [Paramecium octaurelia]|uniref:Uncharacterized protein n=1 Tax=Paramecium octaurelia TaxID=43137 RepID=A0A8S1WWN6_PAROT|nr:unnamed protein product [Paramecium octaurelia]
MNKNNNNNALRSQTSFMSENHALKPYGNNFIDHPYMNQKYFINSIQSNSMSIWRKMINLKSPNIILHILNLVQEGHQQQLQEFCNCFQNALRNHTTPTQEHINYYKHLYLGLLVASGVLLRTHIQPPYILIMCQGHYYINILKKQKGMGSKIMKSVSNNNEGLCVFIQIKKLFILNFCFYTFQHDLYLGSGNVLILDS